MLVPTFIKSDICLLISSRLVLRSSVFLTFTENETVLETMILDAVNQAYLSTSDYGGCLKYTSILERIFPRTYISRNPHGVRALALAARSVWLFSPLIWWNGCRRSWLNPGIETAECEQKTTRTPKSGGHPQDRKRGLSTNDHCTVPRRPATFAACLVLPFDDEQDHNPFAPTR